MDRELIYIKSDTAMKGKYPILHVKNFGKIRSASIELSPMTLFIGDNNSGKSYLMSLIYGLKSLKFGFGRLGEELAVEGEPEELQEALFAGESSLSPLLNIKRIERNKETVELDEALFGKIVHSINSVLDREKTKIIKSIFNSPIHIESMRLEFPFRNGMSFSMETERRTPVSSPEEVFEPRRVYKLVFTFGKEAIVRSIYWTTIDKQGEGSLVRTSIISKMFMDVFYESFMRIIDRNSNILFLPSSRTGFMLTRKNIIGDLIERSGIDGFTLMDGNQGRSLYLTKPVIDYLRFISTVRTENPSNRFMSALELLVSDILEGEIAVLESTQEFRYTPKGSKALSLPLYISSGVVTELVSLVLALRYGNPRELFIEEPEISLHPQLQLLIAQVMVRIINEGSNLFVSTHSDTIIQHLNNMIKLATIPDKNRKETLMKRYGYRMEDLLNPSKIGMYQFTVDHKAQETTVTRLIPEEYGFRVPTFSKTFKDLINETADLEDEE